MDRPKGSEGVVTDLSVNPDVLDDPDQLAMGVLRENPVAGLRFVLGLERVPEVNAFKHKPEGTLVVEKEVNERYVKKFISEYIVARMQYDLDLANELVRLVDHEGLKKLQGTTTMMDVEKLALEARYTIELSRAIIETVRQFEDSPQFLNKLAAPYDKRVPQIFAYLNTHGHLPFKSEKKRAAALELFVSRLPN